MGAVASLPLSLAATAATTAATQLVCCCSSAACHCCSKALTPASSTATRAAYAVMFAAVSIVAWTTQAGWIDSLFASIPGLDDECPPGRCDGPFAVLRMMSALTLFHLGMALLTLGVKDSHDSRAGLQNGWWGVKIGAWVVFSIIAFVIPNAPFTYYGYASFVGAVLFLFVQLVLLIDFAASWSESWVGKFEDTGERKWIVLLIGSVVVMLLSSVVLTVLLYVYFCRGGGCGLNTFFVTFNLVLGIIACLACIHPKIQEVRPASGLLQGATVFLYMTYLITSAISDEVNDANEGGFQCNPFASSSAQQASTIIGTLFTFIVIAFSTTRAAAKSKLLLSNEVPPTESAVEEPLVAVVSSVPVAAEPMAAAPATATAAADATATAAADAPKHLDVDEKGVPKLDPDARRRHLQAAVEEGALPKSALEDLESGTAAVAEKDGDDEPLLAADDERNGTTYSYAFFHLIFAAGAMYIAMLLTNWNTADPLSGSLVNVGHDWISVWVKVVSSWAVFVLFVWTLVAPIVLPDRQWS